MYSFHLQEIISDHVVTFVEVPSTKIVKLYGIMVFYKYRRIAQIFIFDILVILTLEGEIGVNAQAHQIEVDVETFKQER